MRQSTLLIGQSILQELHRSGVLEKAGGLKGLLGILLKDPLLWKKLEILESKKYTKTYQSEGLDLTAFKFYPVPEDWCELSAISNGVGFSRCFIFIYLLEYYLGIRQLEKKVTIIKSPSIYGLPSIQCHVTVSRSGKYLLRELQKPGKRTLHNYIKLKKQKIMLI